jgi:hypothetical protein
MSVGAQFFPTLIAGSGGDGCDSKRYADPYVDIQPVASGRSHVASAMGSLVPDGSTPMGPALIGAVAGARAWATGHPKATAVVVLATDGLPSGCSPTNAAGLAAIAAGGAAGTPPLATFVIGILGTNDVASGALGTLDAIAQAGGTSQALVVDPSEDLASQMASALRAVAAQGVACSFALPSSIDAASLAMVNVALESAACGRHVLDYVPPGGACDGDGWRYDVDPALGQLPSKVLLCATTCERFRAGDQASLEVGCATKGWPPT